MSRCVPGVNCFNCANLYDQAVEESLRKVDIDMQVVDMNTVLFNQTPHKQDVQYPRDVYLHFVAVGGEFKWH